MLAHAAALSSMRHSPSGVCDDAVFLVYVAQGCEDAMLFRLMDLRIMSCVDVAHIAQRSVDLGDSKTAVRIVRAWLRAEHAVLLSEEDVLRVVRMFE